MGVFCQIHLKKPKHGVYTPDTPVVGTVMYALNKETIFSEITVSLIGHAKVDWSEGTGDKRKSYSNSEDLYKNKINIIGHKRDGTNFQVGSYKAPFEFILPHNIPSSFKDPVCKIIHEVRIRFRRPGVFKFDKIFRTEIPVIGNVIPSAQNTFPVIIGHEKKLGLFGNNTINMRATVTKNTMNPGERLAIDFAIDNESNVKLDRISVALAERKVYKASCGHTKTSESTIGYSKVRYNPIEKGGQTSFQYHLEYPENETSIQHTKVFERNLYIKLSIKPPFPYLNTQLQVPMYFGRTPDVGRLEKHVYDYNCLEEEEDYDDPPPSYWQVMAEDDKISASASKLERK